MEKELISLDEHNAKRTAEFHAAYLKASATGIACPKCGAELYDQYPIEQLRTVPPQRKTVCLNKQSHPAVDKPCGYHGTRVI